MIPNLVSYLGSLAKKALRVGIALEASRSLMAGLDEQCPPTRVLTDG